MKLFEDFEYVNTIEDPDEPVAALIFRTRVGDRRMDGLDLLSFDDDGLVTELKVMLRPKSAVDAMAAASIEPTRRRVDACQPFGARTWPGPRQTRARRSSWRQNIRDRRPRSFPEEAKRALPASKRRCAAVAFLCATTQSRIPSSRRIAMRASRLVDAMSISGGWHGSTTCLG